LLLIWLEQVLQTLDVNHLSRSSQNLDYTVEASNQSTICYQTFSSMLNSFWFSTLITCNVPQPLSGSLISAFELPLPVILQALKERKFGFSLWTKVIVAYLPLVYFISIYQICCISKQSSLELGPMRYSAWIVQSDHFLLKPLQVCLAFDNRGNSRSAGLSSSWSRCKNDLNV